MFNFHWTAKLIVRVNICGYTCFVDIYKIKSFIYHMMYNLFKDIVQEEVAAIEQR